MGSSLFDQHTRCLCQKNEEARLVDDPFWRKLWNLDCPKKMIHFLWRLGHNTLALRVNLRRRGMKIDTKCVMCERYDEDGAHLFFKCKGVRQVWANLQLDELWKELAGLFSVREVMEAILKLNVEMQRKVITLLYLWWSERCGVREGEQRKDSDCLARWVGSYETEWSKSKQTKADGEFQAKISKRWSPPPENLVKINCDGAFFSNTRSGGWGFLIRE